MFYSRHFTHIMEYNQVIKDEERKEKDVQILIEEYEQEEKNIEELRVGWLKIVENLPTELRCLIHTLLPLDQQKLNQQDYLMITRTQTVNLLPGQMVKLLVFSSGNSEVNIYCLNDCFF